MRINPLYSQKNHNELREFSGLGITLTYSIFT